jgi:hypothetical protein
MKKIAPMNKKIFKNFILLAIAGFGIFFMSHTAFAAGLSVSFETTPLFSETNFAPRDSVTKWVKVTNNSGSTQKIAVETINENDPDRLADNLNVVIKEGDTERYNDTLAHFFAVGEKYLSDLANNTETEYDFTVTFDSSAGDDLQGKTLGFDILIGFEGQEGGQSSGGGGGGAVLPQGLSIYNEATILTSTTSVTITWNTSYQSTSQVIYALENESHTLDLSDASGTPLKYGYARTTAESDISPKVISHSVTIFGLDPSTTYYYRTVSHGSLAISQEHSFTTLSEIAQLPSEQQLPTGQEISGTVSQSGSGIPVSQITGTVTNQSGVTISTGTTTETGEETAVSGEGSDLTASLKSSVLSQFGANLAAFFQNIPWWMLVILAFLLLLLFVTKRHKKREVTSNK